MRKDLKYKLSFRLNNLLIEKNISVLGFVINPFRWRYQSVLQDLYDEFSRRSIGKIISSHRPWLTSIIKYQLRSQFIMRIISDELKKALGKPYLCTDVRFRSRHRFLQMKSSLHLPRSSSSSHTSIVMVL